MAGVEAWLNEPSPKSSVCAVYVRRKKKVDGQMVPIKPELEVEKKVEDKTPEEKYVPPVSPRNNELNVQEKVKVGELVFPADFIIRDMETDSEAPILLGRPFMSTSKTKLDVKSRSLTMEFDGKVVSFKVFGDKTFFKNVSTVCAMDLWVPIIKDEAKVDDMDAEFPKMKPDKKKKGEPPWVGKKAKENENEYGLCHGFVRFVPCSDSLSILFVMLTTLTSLIISLIPTLNSKFIFRVGQTE